MYYFKFNKWEFPSLCISKHQTFNHTHAFQKDGIWWFRSSEAHIMHFVNSRSSTLVRNLRWQDFLCSGESRGNFEPLFSLSLWNRIFFLHCYSLHALLWVAPNRIPSHPFPINQRLQFFRATKSESWIARGNLLQIFRRAATNEFDGCRPERQNHADDCVDRLSGLQPSTGMGRRKRDLCIMQPARPTCLARCVGCEMVIQMGGLKN